MAAKRSGHTGPGLRGLADACGLLLGAAISTFDLADPRRRQVILQDFNLVTPEYEMKWDALSDRSGAAPYESADAIVTFAADAGLSVHGHALWWHGAVPERFRDTSGPAFADAAMTHLAATARRYAGQLHSWDVVNEPLEPDHGRPDGLRRSRFLEALGPGYIGLAFREVSSADPKAKLILNEMGIEYQGPEADRKRRCLVSLLERELAAGTPIHGLGLQSHLDVSDPPHRNSQFRTFLREIGRLRVPVLVTELDVSDRWAAGNTDRRDQDIADTYRGYLELVLEECRTLAACTWGLSDDRSWLAADRSRPNRAIVRPLPRDRSLRRKPAWHAIEKILAENKSRAGPLDVSGQSNSDAG